LFRSGLRTPGSTRAVTFAARYIAGWFIGGFRRLRAYHAAYRLVPACRLAAVLRSRCDRYAVPTAFSPLLPYDATVCGYARLHTLPVLRFYPAALPPYTCRCYYVPTVATRFYTTTQLVRCGCCYAHGYAARLFARDTVCWVPFLLRTLPAYHLYPVVPCTLRLFGSFAAWFCHSLWFLADMVHHFHTFTHHASRFTTVTRCYRFFISPPAGSGFTRTTAVSHTLLHLYSSTVGLLRFPVWFALHFRIHARTVAVIRCVTTHTLPVGYTFGGYTHTCYTRTVRGSRFMHELRAFTRFLPYGCRYAPLRYTRFYILRTVTLPRFAAYRSALRSFGLPQLPAHTQHRCSSAAYLRLYSSAYHVLRLVLPVPWLRCRAGSVARYALCSTVGSVVRLRLVYAGYCRFGSVHVLVLGYGTFTAVYVTPRWIATVAATRCHAVTYTLFHPVITGWFGYWFTAHACLRLLRLPPLLLRGAFPGLRGLRCRITRRTFTLPAGLPPPPLPYTTHYGSYSYAGCCRFTLRFHTRYIYCVHTRFIALRLRLHTARLLHAPATTHAHTRTHLTARLRYPLPHTLHYWLPLPVGSTRYGRAYFGFLRFYRGYVVLPGLVVRGYIPLSTFWLRGLGCLRHSGCERYLPRPRSAYHEHAYTRLPRFASHPLHGWRHRVTRHARTATFCAVLPFHAVRSVGRWLVRVHTAVTHTTLLQFPVR